MRNLSLANIIRIITLAIFIFLSAAVIHTPITFADYPACVYNDCNSWSNCVNGQQTTTCFISSCDAGSNTATCPCIPTQGDSITKTQACTAPPACTWTCSGWSTCSGNTQSRTCSPSPAGCIGTNPNPTVQSCTAPLVDTVVPTATPTVTPSPTPTTPILACGSACGTGGSCSGAAGGCSVCNTTTNTCQTPSVECGSTCTVDSDCTGAGGGCGSCQSGVCSVPSQTALAFTVFLHGIGHSGDSLNAAFSDSNQSPQPSITITPYFPVNRTDPPIHVFLFDSNNNPVGNPDGIDGTLTYSSQDGDFIGTVNVGSIPSGVYTVEAKVDGFVEKTFSHSQQLVSGETVTVPTQSLVAGDINGDNQLDILDYNILSDCDYGTLNPLLLSDPNSTYNSPSCESHANRYLADLNADGVIDSKDYNLFIRELSSQNGLDNNLTPTPTLTPCTKLGSTEECPTGLVCQETGCGTQTGGGVHCGAIELACLPPTSPTPTPTIAPTQTSTPMTLYMRLGESAASTGTLPSGFQPGGDGTHFPNGFTGPNSTAAAGSNAKLLDTVAGSSQLSTTATGCFFGCGIAQFISPPLAAQTIAGGQWTFGYAMSQNGGPTTTQSIAVVYLLEPDGVTIRGGGIISSSVIKQHSDPGSSERTYLGSLSGGTSTVVAGDRLVVEVGMISFLFSTTATGYFDGTIPITTDDVTISSAKSFVTVPSTLQFLSQ